ncbi:MAG: LysR family transcriptional regulator [Hydrocarboniphaga sp.]|uniref:LysR family transcriptional regulator n=1 Tax=Hydrocarboniphaga sp. TaxID=2033016 RepID=UPI00260F9A0B|nr:LysR family transcriptional regulator [Hydrocarboniphaga sp.]MDB5968101.1 LysR family transcriptional regulator [Hydrocarboniphaga sp.]
MDTQDLNAFVEVAETGSFSAAAERLHLTQPAISKRVASLENRLKRPLFDRVGRRITLTEAGIALLPYARRVLHELEDGRRAVSRLSVEISGRLSIGTSHHIGLHRLPPVLKHYTQHYPEVDLDIHFMDSEDACDAVLAGKLELGIVTLPLAPLPKLEQRLVWPDPLAVVVSPEHELSRLKTVDLTMLAAHPAVLPDAATYTHRIITSALQRHGVAPRVRLATNYLETLKMLVAIGLGWSVLPRSMLDDSIRAIDVAGFELQRELGIVWHQRRTQSAPARALIEELLGTAT